MSAKRAIKRFFLTLMWLGVAVCMLVLIVAAMRAQDESLCKGYSVDIVGAQQDKLFTSEADIEKLIQTAAGGEVTGKRKADFDLVRMEDLLEQSAWVYDAELYFTNSDILKVKIVERKPLARVFTDKGLSFYIDEAGKQIPLSEKVSLDVPVFTGYVNKIKMNAEDSVFLQNMIATASFISNDSFWNAQVAQINITNCGADCRSMEMIPVVGSHKVDLGDGSDIASKFHRLMLFYEQVLKRKGLDKYKEIDVQYAGQVIGKKENQSRIDSLQLRKNIESLLQQSRRANVIIDEMPAVVPGSILTPIDSADAAIYGREVDADSTDIMPVNPRQLAEPVREIAAPAVPAAKPAASKPAVKKEDTPKAMPKEEKAASMPKKAEADKKPSAVKPNTGTKETQAPRKASANDKKEEKKNVTGKTTASPVKNEVKKKTGQTDKPKSTTTSSNIKNNKVAAKPTAVTSKKETKPEKATSNKTTTTKKKN
ncbi:MAG: hypothetical protein QM727_14900 [Niabella sp.]